MISKITNSKKKAHSSWLVAHGSQFLLFIIMLLLGCEKVIDVDLNEANPEVVIEGNLSGSSKFAEVKLSKTGSYFGNSPIEKIVDAVVTIEDEIGRSFVLAEVEEGVYRTDKISPKEESTYTLFVDVKGQKYESTSKLNPLVEIDSLVYEYDKGFAFLDAGYILKMHFTDPANRKNYYRIKIFKQDSILYEYDNIIVFDDRLINGQTIEVTLRESVFDINDTVSVEFITLDKGAYEYYKTFYELINVNAGSAAPANPTSNISNGALGFFSAWSADEKTVIIKEE